MMSHLYFKRNCLAAVFILVVATSHLHAQVTPIGAAAQTSATNTITSFTAVAGTNRVLIVTASDAASDDITSVTFNGNPMTERAERTDGFAVSAIYTFPLGTSPNASVGAIIITSTNGTDSAKCITARVYENVDQTTPLTSIQSASNVITPSASTLVVSSAPGDLVFDIFDSGRSAFTPNGHTTGAGQTVVHSVAALPVPDGFNWWTTSTKPGATAVSMSRTTTDHFSCIHIAANINATFNIIGTTPPPNASFALGGFLALDINFNSPLDPASVQSSDLSVSGIAGTSVIGVTLGSTNATFLISGILTEGTLTASINAGAITDASGNPNPAFSASYFARQPITVFPYFHTFPVGTNWTVSQTTSLWQLAIATGPRGSTDTVAKADFFNIGAGNVGYLRSPLLNLPVIPNPGAGGALVMTFHVAYRAYTGGENDSLAVVLSTDGGVTFPNELWVKSRNSTPSLATLPQSSASFFPTAASDWRRETVILNSYQGRYSVIIAFRANSRFGNNCFIDNVRINLAEKLTTHVVNGTGFYPADGGLEVYIQNFGVAQPQGLQSGGQHVSMNFDGSPRSVSSPPEKLARRTTDITPMMPPQSSRIPGGTLYISSYTGRPPTTSPVEFAPNSFHSANDNSIFTPNNLSDNRWWTITYSGDDSLRALWSEYVNSTALPGVTNANKLYLMERSERDGSWTVWTTRIANNELFRGALRQGFTDVAVGSRTDFNPNLWNLLKGNVRVILQGPHGGGTSFLNLAGALPMSTALKANGILDARFGSNVPATAVDSIAVEIRNAPTAAASTIRQIQPAWLLRNGAIVNFSDTTKQYVEFGGAPNGNYYLVVWHRNHLGIMSATPQALTTGVPVEYNFTTAQSQAYGTNAMVEVESGVYGMYGGDANASNTITNSDVTPVFNALNAFGYLPGDINLSGVVTAADANLILQNVNKTGQVTKPAGGKDKRGAEQAVVGKEEEK